jgi:hypothetical protein
MICWRDSTVRGTFVELKVSSDSGVLSKDRLADNTQGPGRSTDQVEILAYSSSGSDKPNRVLAYRSIYNSLKDLPK